MRQRELVWKVAVDDVIGGDTLVGNVVVEDIGGVDVVGEWL